jgi:peptide/nickel transport system permease protein
MKTPRAKVFAGSSKAQIFTVIFSTGIIALLIIFALFGDYIVHNSPVSGQVTDRMKPPVWMNGGIWKYPLGTDTIGRCILSRIISGTKYSLGICGGAILLSAFCGGLLGIFSGYLGGVFDSFVMRVVDLGIAFPLLLLGMMVAMALGQSAISLFGILFFAQTARFARQIRGEVLTLKEADFIAYAHIAGCSKSKVVFRHFLPNTLNTLMVMMTLQMGWAILAESSFSFLGAGIPAPAPSWGAMVSDGKEYIATHWWISIIPGLVIMLTIIAWNSIGDWIRDRFDPRLRQL